eukprot:7985943-Lingulodinium_polyedra.AAC.1
MMRRASMRSGAGQTMATPPCLPPCGPRRAGAAATLACGMSPACQTAAVEGSQCVSCSRMTVSALTPS